jgi:hypothetical protein
MKSLVQQTLEVDLVFLRSTRKSSKRGKKEKKQKQKVTRATPDTIGLHASLICAGDTETHQLLPWNHDFGRRMCRLKVADTVHMVLIFLIYLPYCPQ